VIGAMAALRAWAARDHAAVRRREAGALMLWRERLSRIPGLTATIVPDPTDNPLDRLEVRVDPAAAGAAAWDLADALAAGDPPVIVRDHEVEHGLFYLDPCNLHPGQEAVVANRIEETCGRAAAGGVARTTLAERKARRLAGLLAWPD
jgi:L-seryl-tRNA(Ser) seleniumtransferase